MTTSTLNISSLEDDTHRLDSVFDRTAKLREQITDKLMTAVNSLVIEPNSTPSKQLEAQISLVSSAAAVLNDMDAQLLKRVGVKTKLKEIDTNNKHSAAVVQLLKALQSNNLPIINDKPIVQENVDLIIEESFADNGGEILDTELKEDATDLK